MAQLLDKNAPERQTVPGRREVPCAQRRGGVVDSDSAVRVELSDSVSLEDASSLLSAAVEDDAVAALVSLLAVSVEVEALVLDASVPSVAVLDCG